MGELSAPTGNVRLSAARKLVKEAWRNGMLGAEEAANLGDVPNVRQQGTRLVNRLTREQTRELLRSPIGKDPDGGTLRCKWLPKMLEGQQSFAVAARRDSKEA